MPGGVCGICQQSARNHAYDCPRWRAAERGSAKNRTSGWRQFNGSDHASVKQTKARLRALIKELQSSYLPFVLTRYQASTGVVVLKHGSKEADLERTRADMEADAQRRFPPPDSAKYEVVPRSVLRLKLESANDDTCQESAVTSTSATRSARLSTGT
jgi:hypothetical protein